MQFGDPADQLKSHMRIQLAFGSHIPANSGSPGQVQERFLVAHATKLIRICEQNRSQLHEHRPHYPAMQPFQLAMCKVSSYTQTYVVFFRAGVVESCWYTSCSALQNCFHIQRI